MGRPARRIGVGRSRAERGGLFKSREQLAGFGARVAPFASQAAPAALSVDQIVAPARIKRSPHKGWRQWAHELRYDHLPALRDTDWVPDLAIDIVYAGTTSDQGRDVVCTAHSPAGERCLSALAASN